MGEREMKTCPKCCETKSRSKFRGSASRKDGLHPWCKQCAAAASAAWAARNRERVNARKKEWRAANPDKVARERAVGALWREANREELRIRQAEYRKAYPEKDRAKQEKYRKAHPEVVKAQHAKRYARDRDGQIARVVAYQKANRSKANALESARRARELQATPAWANDFFIKEIYASAALRTKLTGIKWHVDHRVPLRSKIVCGLHCEANLQVIPAVHNIRKGNRVWENMP